MKLRLAVLSLAFALLPAGAVRAQTAAQTAAQKAFAEGQALVAAKRPADAAAKFEAAVSADPAFAPGWYALAAARRRAGQCDRAITAYRRYAQLQPLEVEPYYGLGLCLREVGDKKGATEALYRYVAQEKRPASQRWVEHARTVLAELGPPPSPASSSPSASSSSSSSSSSSHSRESSRSQAVPDGGVPPGSAGTAAYVEAQSLRDRGHIEEAVAKFKQAIAADSSHMAARAALGELLLKIRRDDEAITVFKAAVDKNPSYPLAWYDLAFALRARGKLSDAVDAYQRYIKLRPSDPDPYYGMARALQKLGRTQAAIRAYETYVAMEKRPSEQKWVQAAQEQLQALAGSGTSATKSP